MYAAGDAYKYTYKYTYAAGVACEQKKRSASTKYLYVIYMSYKYI